MSYIGAIVKRCVDVVFSLIACVLLSPILICVCLYIGLFEGGAAIFSHRRVGRGGKEFYCFKFRSMVLNSDEVLASHLEFNSEARKEWGETQKLKLDPRVTMFGKAIRKLSIDELPQFFNVLRGDMSIVGPRPVTRKELRRYGRSARYYLACKPGITGPWQVNGRNDVSYARRVAFDRTYFRTQSICLDAKIILLTILVILRPKGAY